MIIITTNKNPYEENYSTMEDYIKVHGKHFSEKMCEFAISNMGHNKGKLTKEEIDSILNNKIPKNNKEWDYVFVANMAFNDFYGSSLKDQQSVALYINDYINDEDGYDGLPFCRWYADIREKDIQIDWLEMI